MSKGKYAVYEALEPYLELVRKGLNDLVDGEHYFDTVAEDAAFEFLYEFPGWPRTILGRPDLMARYSGYGKNIKLHSADKLEVYHADNGRVVILECEVHGTILATGVPYHNRLLSIITIGDRKIVHWRDYMDSLAAWNALTAPAR
jgi:ketosteroid isomerase-like protein